MSNALKTPIGNGQELINALETLNFCEFVNKSDLADLQNKVKEYAEDISRTQNQKLRITCSGNYNSGKSSLLNALVGEDRFKVGDIPRPPLLTR